MLILRLCKSVRRERDGNVHAHESKGISTSSQTGSTQDAQSWHKLYCVCFLQPAAGASLTCSALTLHNASFTCLPPTAMQENRGNKIICWDANAIKSSSFQLQMRVETAWKTKQMSRSFFLPSTIFTTNFQLLKNIMKQHA